MAIKMARRYGRRKKEKYGGAAATCGEDNIVGSRRRGARRKEAPLETGLAKITICASSFAWAHGKRCLGGFQVTQKLTVLQQ